MQRRSAKFKERLIEMDKVEKGELLEETHKKHE